MEEQHTTQLNLGVNVRTHTIAPHAPEEMLGGRPLFTRQLLATISNIVQKAKAGQGPFYIQDHFGNTCEIPKIPSDSEVVGISYRTRYQLARRGVDLATQHTTVTGEVDVPFKTYHTRLPVGLFAESRDETGCLDYSVLRHTMDDCAALWNESEARTTLLSHLLKQVSLSKSLRIRKVVSMGLGSFRRVEHYADNYTYGPYFQHLAACTIATELGTYYEKYPNRFGHHLAPIEVVFQDPNYSIADKQLISALRTKMPGCAQILEDPEAILAIDEHTLVLSVSATFPLYEIIADIVPNGPAAILCNELPAEVEAKRMCDSRTKMTPRVVGMLQDFRVTEINAEFSVDELEATSKSKRSALKWLLDMRLFFKP